LEIIALDFEEVEQQDSLERVHAFIQPYQVPYDFWIAGATGWPREEYPHGVCIAGERRRLGR
jgi:hypothetical protein